MVAVAIAVGALLIRSVHEVPGLLIAYGRYAATRTSQADEIIYKGEGMMASVAVSRLSNGVLNYHNAGKIQASSEPQDMRLQRMLGHLTTLLPPAAEDGDGHRLRRGRDRRRRLDRAAARAGDDRRDRAAGAEGRLDLLQRAQFRRRPEPEGQDPDRRRAALSADDQAEVRRRHVRSARPVGQGRRDALHEGVLRRGQDAPEPRRRRHAVRAALREQSGGGEERAGDVLRGVPQRRGLRQHEQRGGLRHGPRRQHRAAADQRRRNPAATRSARVRAGGPVAARDRLQLGDRAVLHLRRSRLAAEAVAEGCRDQPRPEPAAAVSRRPRVESLSGRSDLLGDGLASGRSRRSVRRLPGDAAEAAGPPNPPRRAGDPQARDDREPAPEAPNQPPPHPLARPGRRQAPTAPGEGRSIAPATPGCSATSR